MCFGLELQVGVDVERGEEKVLVRKEVWIF